MTKAASELNGRGRKTPFQCFRVATNGVTYCSFLSNTTRLISIGKNLPETLATKQDFRQDDSLFCDFINWRLEKVLRDALF